VVKCVWVGIKEIMSIKPVEISTGKFANSRLWLGFLQIILGLMCCSTL
jgi:hypothetical protein